MQLKSICEQRIASILANNLKVQKKGNKISFVALLAAANTKKRIIAIQ